MERVKLKELHFRDRAEAMAFLKGLWRQEKTACPFCGEELELLHKKAKKGDCDWQCEHCDRSFKTLYLLDEINEQMPGR